MWGPYKRCSKKCLLLTQVHYPLPPTIASLEDMIFILPFFVNFLIKFWSILLEQKSSGQIVLFAVDDICTHCPELIFPGQELENSGFPKLPDLRRPQTRFLTFPINLAASSNPPLPYQSQCSHTSKQTSKVDRRGSKEANTAETNCFYTASAKMLKQFETYKTIQRPSTFGNFHWILSTDALPQSTSLSKGLKTNSFFAVFQ